MPQMTAMPILAAAPPVAATGPAASPPTVQGKPAGNGNQTNAAARATQTTSDQDAAAPASADEASGNNSFAAVLGRQMAKDAKDASAAADAPLVAVTGVVVAADGDTKAKPTEQNNDGTDAQAGIASLLPLLQSLQAGTPLATKPSGSSTDAQGNGKNLAALQATSLLAGQSALSDKAALAEKAALNDKLALDDKEAQSAKPVVSNTPALATTPLVADAAGDERLAAAQRRQGEAGSGQPQETLPAADNGTISKDRAANPAASLALANETKPAQVKPTDISESNFANLLANAQAPSHTGRSSAPLQVEAPMGSRNWDSNVGEKVVWMVGHQEQRADLVLNPPELGKVEVSVSVNGDQASAQFVSANPAVRDALEAALPRLREMLADAGINLGQAQVGSDSAQNAPGNSANNRENGDNSRRGSGDAGQVGLLRPMGTAGSWQKQGTGMVDVFA